MKHATDILRALLLAGIGLSLTACVHKSGATSTALSSAAQAAPGDVGAVKRGDNLYDVVYVGADKSTDDYVRDMTLYQSAELCQSQGFKYFRASHTPAYSNHEAPVQPAPEAPKLTLQVSCLLAANDATVSYGVQDVIDRVRSSYNLQ